MRVADLSHRELAGRMRSGSLCLSIGPFNISFAATNREFVQAFATLYSAFPVNADNDPVDVVVRLRNTRQVRTGWTLRVEIDVDCASRGSVAAGTLVVPAVEWSINWAIATRAHFLAMLHAAVIAWGDTALIMPGPPGSGKSTLCAALVGRGCRLLSDEFALVHLETCELLPMPRPISLKNRSIDLIRELVPLAIFGPMARGTLKGDVAHMAPPSNSVYRQSEVAKPAWIVFPRWHPEGSTVLSPTSKGEAFVALTRNSINYSLLGAAGFETVCRLVRQCDCFIFDYSDVGLAASRLQEMVDGRLTDAAVSV